MDPLLLVGWLSASAVVAALAHAKGHNALLYFGLSLFVTPVATIVVMALMPRRPAAFPGPGDLVSCHYCSLPRLAASPVCPHCQAGPTVLMPNLKQCHHCSAKVLPRATICVHCGAELRHAPTLAPARTVVRLSEGSSAGSGVAAWERLEP